MKLLVLAFMFSPLLAFTSSGATAGGPPAPGSATRDLCVVTDPRLREMTGLAASDHNVFVSAEMRDGFYVVDRSCRVTGVNRVGASLNDVEHLSLAADGTFWLSSAGGSPASVSDVRLVLWDGQTREVTNYWLGYPGPHETDALLVSPQGTAVLVARGENSTSQVFSTAGPLDASRVNPLELIGQLPAAQAYRSDPDRDSTAVTGGAVSPDGTRVTLRTADRAYEWDAPDGDIATAITHRRPDAIDLPRASTGEAVTYTPSGRGLVVGSERVPSPLYLVPLPRRLVGGARDEEPAWPPVIGLLALATVTAVIAQLLASDRRAAATGQRSSTSGPRLTPTSTATDATRPTRMSSP